MANHKYLQAGVVYVLEMEGHDYFKVGWCKRAIQVKHRIARLQTGNPARLKLIALKHRCTLADEQKLQSLFRGMDHSHWVGGEWFTQSQKLSEFISSNQWGLDE